MNTSGNNAAADTPAEIAARKFANDVAREIARKLEIDLGSAMWLVDLIDKRFAEQQSERIRELEQGLDAADDFIRGVYADLLGVPLSDARSRNMQHVCVGVIDAIKTLEQANKELLEALRAIPENLENVDWVRARYNAGIEWGVEWSEGTTDQSLGAFSPWKFCQNVASEIRAALSKHGGAR